MATTYAELKTEIADFLERSDLTTVIDTFIDLTESEMQRELQMLSLETTADVATTAGVATMPTGFITARSVTWVSSNPTRILKYVTPDELERLNASNPSYVNWYTIIGSSIKVGDDQDGTLRVTYEAGFTPLSGTNDSNIILANHPAAYLYGSLTHGAVYCKDFEGAIAYRKLFDNELSQINRDNRNRRFSGPAAVRLA